MAECLGITKAGQRCRSTSVGPSGFCSVHGGTSPLGTTEGALLGARRSAEVRQAKAEQRRKTLKDLLAEKLEAHADEVVACFLENVREGDWRAADAFVTRVYGKPQDRLEVSKPEDAFDWSEWSLEDLRAFKARLIEDYPEFAHLAERQR